MTHRLMQSLESVYLIATGEGYRFNILTRAAETGGANYTVETSVAPGAIGYYPDRPGSPPLHRHMRQARMSLSWIFDYLGC